MGAATECSAGAPDHRHAYSDRNPGADRDAGPTNPNRDPDQGADRHPDEDADGDAGPADGYPQARATNPNTDRAAISLTVASPSFDHRPARGDRDATERLRREAPADRA